MVVKNQAQIGLEDDFVVNSELLDLLERRQHCKEGAKEANKVYRDSDKSAMTAIELLDHSMPYRIGRFIIKRKLIKAKSVQFETTEKSGISISTVSDEYSE